MTMLDKNFDHHQIEKKWLTKWLEENIFQAGQDKSKKPYVIMMPPPNVTGALHNGHALFVTLQDILARFYRMKGFDVLWLPGTDHAGIATQTVVERELLKKENKTKYDLGREKFLERVFEWKDKHGDKIIEQLKMLGASADWSRLRFTMDDQCSKAVRKAFIKLWDDGLIYRKKRLISWDPETKTALSNEEVEHLEKKGELVYFAYRLKDDENQEIIVATTRVETMLGDVAVAVNPNDDRYKKIIGKMLVHPFFPSREICVIADDYVDKDFGSGAVKITPAHDPNDFLMGERHKLEMVSIFDFDGKINQNGGQFIGQDRKIARKNIKNKLAELGLLRKVEEITHSVSISQRSGVDIEPMLSSQYFVNAKPLAKMAYDAVDKGETKIIPASFKKIWDHFLLNIQDWCISRQLWWGHRIPVYYKLDAMKKAVQQFGNESLKALNDGMKDEYVLKMALEELDENVVRSFSFALENDPHDLENYIQEEDVLDTWFSSGLWPFSTLGWPDETDDLKRYYPSNVLETGFDILFFWVARMMMFGIYFMGKPPFSDVFLHSMVRDAHGRKMSKSIGNAIDPKDVIDGITLNDLVEKTKTYPVHKDHLPSVIAGLKKDFPEGIPSAGADGLRLSLAIFSGQGQDVKFSVPRVVGYRAFLNKVWNATRFAMMNIEGFVKPLDEIHSPLSLADKYILSRLNRAVKKVDECITEYKFSEAAESIYHFFWNEYCSEYIECVKLDFKDSSQERKEAALSVLVHLLDVSMRLIHPFCPFISEEIFSTLNNFRDEKNSFLSTSAFPKADENLINPLAEEKMQKVLSIVNTIRNLRQESGLAANLELNVIIMAKDTNTLNEIKENEKLIMHLARALAIDLSLKGQKSLPKLCAINSTLDYDIAIDLKGLIDIEKETARIESSVHKILLQKEKIAQKLNDENFVQKAPKHILENFQNELSQLEEKEKQLLLAKKRFME